MRVMKRGMGWAMKKRGAQVLLSLYIPYEADTEEGELDGERMAGGIGYGG